MGFEDMPSNDAEKGTDVKKSLDEVRSASAESDAEAGVETDELFQKLGEETREARAKQEEAEKTE